MGAVLGTLSALAIGLADLFGRRVVLVSGALTAAVAIQVIAILTSLLSVGLFGGELVAGDALIGLGSGIGLGVGLGTYYAGIARSSSTVVSPLVATLSAVIPFAYALLRGASPSVFAVVGAAIAIAGLGLITTGGGRTAHVRVGLRWGVVSGLAYGIGFAVVLDTSADAGAWPAVWQRVAAAILLATFAARRRTALVPPGRVRVAAVFGGIFTGLCAVLYLAGVRIDPTATVITASMFPAASVAIGRTVFGDHVSRQQAIGLGVVLLGIAGVAAG